MGGRYFQTLRSLLLLLVSMWFPAGQAPAASGAKPTPRQVAFRDDDVHAPRIARQMLREEFGQQEDTGSGPDLLRTAWVNVSVRQPQILFVTYGCSPTGNCGLYGFEPTKSGWRLVLNSVAQTCSILPSVHAGRHDISAYMHGSATEGTVKTYWWRKNRYVRVSQHELVVQ
jgi:hypothetical protein